MRDASRTATIRTKTCIPEYVVNITHLTLHIHVLCVLAIHLYKVIDASFYTFYTFTWDKRRTRVVDTKTHYGKIVATVGKSFKRTCFAVSRFPTTAGSAPKMLHEVGVHADYRIRRLEHLGSDCFSTGTRSK